MSDSQRELALKRFESQDEVLRETCDHKDKVRAFIDGIRCELTERALNHDNSKLQQPEVGIFRQYTPKLRITTYGGEEYKGYLREMKPALDHHYAANRHHPEHFENGIQGMNLVDLVEMICDWKAATLRHNDGDIRRSIEINQKRFGYSDDVKAILLNTVDLFEPEPF